MRIIAGEFKGRRINYKIPTGIRPTSDFVRETIFNILKNYSDLQDKSILDLFSGTGFLGLEAISRGAKYCCFVDKSKQSIELIHKITNEFKLNGTKYNLIKCDVKKFIKNPHLFNIHSNFDIIFCDPPYDLNILNYLLQDLAESTLLNQETILVYESKVISQITNYYDWLLYDERILGDTKICIFSRT